jgi:hypothetical protein
MPRRRRGMVRTTCRCGTGASTSCRNHSAHRSWRFFSHDGQKDPPRQENGHNTLVRHVGHQSLAKPWETIPHVRNPRSTHSTTGRSGPCCRAEAGGPDLQQLLEVLLDQTEERRLARPSRPVDRTADLHTSRPAGGRASGENTMGTSPLEEVTTASGSGGVRSRARRSLLELIERVGDRASGEPPPSNPSLHRSRPATGADRRRHWPSLPTRRRRPVYTRAGRGVRLGGPRHLGQRHDRVEPAGSLATVARGAALPVARDLSRPSSRHLAPPDS